MTCNDCWHYKVCCKYDIYGESACECGSFADKSEWVHLPCKVGTIVFTIIEDDEDGDFVDGGFVVSVSYQTKCWIYVRYRCGLTYDHTTDDIGESLFFTREEAEKALDRRKEEK